jgi:hypothetical protein
MPDPVPSVLISIQCSALDIDITVPCVKTFRDPDSGSGVVEGIGNTDRREEGRGDEVDVLAWVGKESEQAEDGEGGHGTTIIVARETCMAGVKAGGNVWRGQWPSSVMMLQWERRE